MLALLLGNAFIVGINQIYDVDIDRVNKPFLPVAQGGCTPLGDEIRAAPPRKSAAKWHGFHGFDF